MKKSLQRKTVYEPNAVVKVTVVNKPVVDEVTGEQLGYKSAMTVKLNLPVSSKELSFATSDELAEFMGVINYDEPQQSLPFNKEGDQNG